MKRQSTSNPEARERLDRYIELRRAGVSALNAAIEVGVDNWDSRKRYERKYRAAEGLPAEPVKPRDMRFAR